MVYSRLSGCGESLLYLSHKKIMLEMCHSVVRSILSALGLACFGEQSSFSDDGETGTNGVGFIYLDI